LYTNFAKSRFTLILIGIIDDKSRKYLKKIIRLSEKVPLNPLKIMSIPDKETITTNKILLKKLSDKSN
jgi:hypothetical protein